jgi:hypothetical protein
VCTLSTSDLAIPCSWLLLLLRLADGRRSEVVVYNPNPLDFLEKVLKGLWNCEFQVD